LNGIEIQQVDATKFLGVYIDEKLGVYIDEKLNWKQTITHVSLKISRSLGILGRVKKILSQKLLLILYYTMIYP